MASSRQAVRDAAIAAIAGPVVAGAAAVVLSRGHHVAMATLGGATIAGALPAALAATSVLRRRPMTSTPADRVTLSRAVLASGCAAIAVLVLLTAVAARTWWLFALTVPALVLDAVDGVVARRTGTASVAGARLDMEVDAGVLVVLCCAVAPVVGAWVLLIGAMRYLLFVVARLRPPLRTTLPRSQFRRVVAALQGIMLAVAIAPVIPVSLARAGLGLALALLLASFASEAVIKERLARQPVDGASER
jgi:phosphatidylglycerophosphate synthase